MTTGRGPARGPIAIDGPAAAGKSTIARLAAERLGWPSLDTGLMYRAVGYLAVVRGLALDDDGALEQAALATEVRTDGQEVVVSAGGATLSTGRLAGAEVSSAASTVAARPAVRAALVAKQRELAQQAEGEIVMVGRDIGTVVLPDAPTKVYLDAPAEERARRRHAEALSGEGSGGVSYAEVLAALRARDARDTEREDSPLRPAPDAHVVESGGLTVDAVVERVLDLAGRDADADAEEGQRPTASRLDRD